MKFIRQLISFFFWFDQRVLDTLESLCHRQQRFFGVTHYFWLKLEAVLLASSIAVYVYPRVESTDKWEFGFLIIALLSAGTFGYNLWENHSLKRIAKGLENPLRAYGLLVSLRVTHCYLIGAMFLIYAIEKPVFLLATLIFALISLLWVLPACDPLPQSEGKLGGLIRKLFART